MNELAENGPRFPNDDAQFDLPPRPVAHHFGSLLLRDWYRKFVVRRITTRRLRASASTFVVREGINGSASPALLYTLLKEIRLLLTYLSPEEFSGYEFDNH